MRRGNPRFWAWIVLVCWGLSLPAMLWGILQATQSPLNDLVQWMPSENQRTRDFLWFRQHFSSGEAIILSWPGCTWEDPRLQRLAEHARELTLQNVGGATADPLFSRVLTGGEMMEQLQAGPAALSQEAASRKLRGTFLGPDGKTSCAVLMLSTRAAQYRTEVLDQLSRLARDEIGLKKDQLIWGGPAVTSAAIDHHSQAHLGLLIAVSVLLSMGLAWLSLRSFRAAGLVFTAASMSQGWAVAWVYYFDSSMNAVLVMMPALVQVLALSASIHLMNYYRRAKWEHPSNNAAITMFRVGWFPALLTTVTTVIGLGSLTLSEIELVRQFGGFAACGVSFACLVVLTFLPAALTVFPVEFAPRKPRLFEFEHPQFAFQGLCQQVLKRHRLIVAAALVTFLALGSGLPQVNTIVKLHSLFPAETEVLQDQNWLEANVGPLVPLEVLLRFPVESELSTFQRAQLVEKIDERLSQTEGLGGILSPATLVGDLVTAGGIRGSLRRQSQLRWLEQQSQDSHLLVRLEDEEIWRISVRLASQPDEDYGVALQRVRQQVEGLLPRQSTNNQPAVTLSLVGVTPLIDHAQHQLLLDLMESFLFGAFLIGLTMMVLLRSPGAGLVSMIPNVFPVVAIFGFMGWMGWPVDVGAMMTASIALGIAVDDTIHYLIHFQRGNRQGLSTEDSIAAAFQHCGMAMTQTAVICGLGMFVFTMSSFLPTARFAWLMFWILVVALLSDLLLLPALLASRFGRVFATAAQPEAIPSTAATADSLAA